LLVEETIQAAESIGVNYVTGLLEGGGDFFVCGRPVEIYAECVLDCG
jgi:hypothetical protein